MLENLTVFVGYRDSHNALLLVRPSVCVRLRSGVVCNVSARDDKTATVDQSICDLGMGAAADHGDRGARDAHALSGFCLAQLLQVNQAQRFQLIDSEGHVHAGSHSIWSEPQVFGLYAHVSRFFTPSHHRTLRF